MGAQASRQWDLAPENAPPSGMGESVATRSSASRVSGHRPNFSPAPADWGKNYSGPDGKQYSVSPPGSSQASSTPAAQTPEAAQVAYRKVLADAHKARGDIGGIPTSASAPAAGGEKQQFSSYWQMAKALNDQKQGDHTYTAGEMAKNFQGKMIQKGDKFDLTAIRGGTFDGASGAKGSFDKWQAARAQKSAPPTVAASPAPQLSTPTPGASLFPARQAPSFGASAQLSPPPNTMAGITAAPSVAQATRVVGPNGGVPIRTSTSVLGTPPPMRSAPVVRSPGEQARTAATVANARPQVRQDSTASSDTIANNALSATKPLVPQLQTQFGNRQVPRT